MFERDFAPEQSFSFSYGGKPSDGLLPTAAVTTFEDGVTEYAVSESFTVRRKVTRYPGFDALWIETEVFNPSEHRSEVISALRELDCLLPMPYIPRKTKPMYSLGADSPSVDRMLGTTWDIHEFETKREYLAPDRPLTVQPERGASSERNAPFFNLHQDGEGVMLSIGWTGQHKTEFCRREGNIKVCCGIPDTEYYLLPQERLRTASVLVMFYSGERRDGQNRFRRLLKQHFSPSDRLGEGEFAPYSFSMWGGLHSDEMLRRIDIVDKNRLGYEYCWIDAGWYGADEKPCDCEDDGWYAQSGTWKVNKGPLYHPDGLEEVSRSVHEKGMKLLMWFHPEVSNKRSELSMSHPEWMYMPSASRYNDFVNIGIPEAAQWLTKTIGDIIEKLKIDCYRQDFCYFPLTTWCENDIEGRRGISQIKHINALYKLWDDLRERFPKLLIDNCAGGGRRLDIEMMRRSVALWRSDMQCTADCTPTVIQCAAQGINSWLPYSGAGSGGIADETYRLRSCYSAGLAVGHWGYKFSDIADSEESYEKIRRLSAEYKKVRPYLTCDYYPLTECGCEDDSWVVWQFDRPEEGDGILLAFRRDNSPFPLAKLRLCGAAAVGAKLTDADSGEIITAENGELLLEMPQKRSSRLLFYRAGK